VNAKAPPIATKIAGIYQVSVQFFFNKNPTKFDPKALPNRPIVIDIETAIAL
jgi:hypothetical protein